MRIPPQLLAVTLVLAGCQQNATRSTQDADGRTLASMLPKLSRSLTPAAAESTFGKPDESLGSGLIIYAYRVESGRVVHLAFPGFAPIQYATITDSSGATTALPLAAP